jgi:tetratricopeptide (TPR) repeat protein
MADTPLKTKPPEPAEIVEAYRSAVSEHPHDVQALADLGWGLYGAAKYAEAVEQFQQALAVDSSYLDAHYGLGLAQKALGDKVAAAAAFDKVADLAKQESEDPVRGAMLHRLAHGHVNEIKDGDWQLEKEIWKREA